MRFKLWTFGAFVAFSLSAGCIIESADGENTAGAGEGGQAGVGGSGGGGGPADETARLFVLNLNQGVSSYAAPAAQDGRIEPATTLTAGPDTDMYGPRDLALGKNGDLYVAAENDGAVVVYAGALGADGAVLPSRKLKGPATGLDVPISIALDQVNDTLYAVNNGSTSATDTTIFAFSGASTLDGDVAPARSIAVDMEGFSPLQIAWAGDTLYAVTQGTSTSSVLVFENATGLDGSVTPSRVIENPDFGQVVSIFVDGDALYAVDDATTLFVYHAGEAEPAATIEIEGAAKLSAIAFDKAGTMFLSDTSANFIYSFDGGAGELPTLAPSRKFDAVGLSLPARISVFEP